MSSPLRDCFILHGAAGFVGQRQRQIYSWCMMMVGLQNILVFILYPTLKYTRMTELPLHMHSFMLHALKLTQMMPSITLVILKHICHSYCWFILTKLY